MHLGAGREPRPVRLGFHRVIAEWLIEAWPARPGIELVIGFEQRMAATDAVIGSGILAPVIFAGERPVGAVFAGDVLLLVGQLRTPFFIGFRNFF